MTEPPEIAYWITLAPAERGAPSEGAPSEGAPSEGAPPGEHGPGGGHTLSGTPPSGEPDTATAPTGPPSNAPLRWRRWAGAVAALAIVAIPLSLPTLPAPATPTADPAASPGGSRPSIEVGQTVRLVGGGNPPPMALPPGWTVSATARGLPALPFSGAARPAFGDAPAIHHVRELLGLPLGAELAPSSAGGNWLKAAARGPGENWPATSVTLPPVYDGPARRSGATAWIEGVDYTDPLGVGLALRQARGYETRPISAHFLIRDFATRDGAPYLRVAPDLVAGLERMRSIVGPLTVISGYRHPRYNALPDVGGARYSRHQSGQAADVFSASTSTVEMAEAAVRAMGCAIGLGLGRNTIHVDVRGYLQTWTYPGAPLSSRDFDGWIRSLCGAAAVPAPLGRAWTGVYEATSEDGGEVVHASAPPVPDASGDGADPVVSAVARSDGRAAAPSAITRGLSDFVGRAFSNGSRGAVVVKLAEGETVADAPLSERARFVLEGSPELHRLGLGPLVRWAEGQPEGAVFVYAVQHADGRVETGAAPLSSPPSRRPDPPADPAEWFLVLGTYSQAANARESLTELRRPLRAVGLGPVLRVEGGASGPRYSVVIGPFTSETEANRAMAQAEGVLPRATTVRSLLTPALDP